MKALIAADLHYNLRQYDWLLQAAAGYDLVIVAGDLLDLAGHAASRERPGGPRDERRL